MRRIRLPTPARKRTRKAKKTSNPANLLRTPPPPACLLDAVRQLREALVTAFQVQERPHLLYLPLTAVALQQIVQQIDTGITDPAKASAAVRMQLRELRPLIWPSYLKPSHDDLHHKYQRALDLAQILEANLTDALPPATIFALGDCQYQIGDEMPVEVSLAEDRILHAFLRRPRAMGFKVLCREAKVSNPSRTLRRLVEKHRFGPAIRMPGEGNQGGYFAQVKLPKAQKDGKSRELTAPDSS